MIKEEKFQKGAKNNAESKSHSVQIKALVVLLVVLSDHDTFYSYHVIQFSFFCCCYIVQDANSERKGQSGLYFGINSSCSSKNKDRHENAWKTALDQLFFSLFFRTKAKISHEDMTDA